MITESPSFRPGRRFTKRMLLANNVAAWIAIFLALYLGEGAADIVVPAMSTYLFALFSAYVGVGHMDLRVATIPAKTKNQGGQQ